MGRLRLEGRYQQSSLQSRFVIHTNFFIRDPMLITFDAGTKPVGSKSRWRVHSPSPSRRQLGAHQEGERGVQRAGLRLMSMGLGTAVSTAHQGLISWEEPREKMI